MKKDARAAELTAVLREQGITDDDVLKAIERTPRHLFVPPTFQDHAYDNTALPIGHGQTVSQPQIVAMMTAALALTYRSKVLEIGTGSGYQTAVLARLARRVYSIERHPALLEDAEARLKQLRLTNVETLAGDGNLGWPDQAPFDRIIVTAAADEAVPPALLDQLGPGGIMVVPVAHSAIDQRLLRLVRGKEGIETTDLGGVRFVPLVSERDDDGDRSRSLSKEIARHLRRRP
ncbi:MAG: protein-L-isoaspartate(D-aspartate) O-methyltransferase [Proteobacteria bacterium]|nr:protein-L-isoaspartate(D-aspartate) O-methyltransferase [Pseudomonadota bacterium]